MKHILVFISILAIALAITNCGRDDIYVPQAETPGEPSTAESGGGGTLEATPFISVLTWNVQQGHLLVDCLVELPFVFYIANVICGSNADLVGIQENWCGTLYPYIMNYKKCYAYGQDHPSMPLDDGCVSFHSHTGLGIFSQYYLSALSGMSPAQRWNMCHGCFDGVGDCHAPKGFLHRTVVKPAMTEGKYFYIEFFTLHTDAGTGYYDYYTRENQLNQLKAFINEYHGDMALIITGDFNLHFDSEGDKDDDMINAFTANLGLTDAVDPNDVNIGTDYDNDGRMDRILFRSGCSNYCGFCRIEKVPNSYLVNRVHGMRYSDHAIVTADLKITRAIFADFTFESNNRKFTFTNTTQTENCHITSWHWDFGDGATSSEQNPSHVYAQDGDYTVRLTATNNYGESDYQEYLVQPLKSLYVVSPNNGEVWVSGENRDITWDYVPAGLDTTFPLPTAEVKIELLKGGVNLGTIANAPLLDKSYAWTVGQFNGGAANPGTDYKIKISVPDSPLPVDTSNRCFTIKSSYDPGISISSPPAGAGWSIGSAYAVRWTTNDIPSTHSMKVSLMQNSGTLKGVLVRSMANDGFWQWTISSFADGSAVMPGDNYYLEFETVVDGATVTGTSGKFTLLGTPSPATITVTAPTSGDIYGRGRTMSIAWSSSGFGGVVNIYLRKYNNASGYTIAEGVPYNGSPYTYEIPADIPKDTYFVRVLHSSIKGESDFFTIDDPAITVTSPWYDEIHTTGNEISTTWTSTGIMGTVDVRLRKCNATDNHLIGPGVPYDSSPFTYTIPEDLPVGKYFIRVKQDEIMNISKVFDIIHPYITVTAPTGGDVYGIGYPIPAISWETLGISGNVTIELRNAADTEGWTLVASVGHDASPYHGCIVPEGIAAGEYFIRVGQSGTAIGDSETFTVVEPVISVSSPVAGEVFGIGETIPEIHWSAQGISGDVRLSFKRADGRDTLDSYVIAADVPWDSSPFPGYTIPSDVTPGDFVICVSQTIVESCTDVFSIVEPSITVEDPSGGETFHIGDDLVVRWSTLGIDGEVQIRMRDDATGVGYFIANPTAYDNSPYHYIIPGDVQPGTYFVRVRQDTVYADSPDFSILGAGSITVTNPAGGEQYTAGGQVDVAWSSDGISGTVDILMLAAEDADPFVLAADVPFDASPTTCTIPIGAAPGSYFIRVEQGSIDGDSPYFDVVQ